MLLDLDIQIKVTNDGKNNNAVLTVNKNEKLQHVTTALELVKENLATSINNFLENKIGGKKVDENFIVEELEKLTFKDLVANS